eukprot:NODE_404_length_1696_cov_199.786885_g322_i0.p1 GENE.NODE_404_length_1696_cov_199.786885_g322_i0~~NODE_404_length_1696_cov_199.786885_g322_i0.p1  ORF type:complete len:511 (+),score=104.16 NODE_404_length_1696_cov_199.786885_g322_i0:48-1535(+)
MPFSCLHHHHFLFFSYLLFLLLLCVTTALGGSFSVDTPTAAFNDWMHSWSPINKQISVGFAPGMGRGLFANSDIKWKSKVLAVPLQFVLNRANVLQQLTGPIRSSVATLHQESAVIAAFMLLQLQQGESARFARWLAILPRSPPPPCTWDTQVLRSLEVPGAAGRLLNQCREYESEFQEAKRNVFDKHFDRTTARRWFTSELWVWARFMVDSRAWTLQGMKFFVPGADMFNHAPDVEDYEFDWSTATGQRSQKFLTHHRIVTAAGVDVTMSGPSDQNAFAVILSDRHCAAGSQLFESYGDPSNREMLDYHAFVPDWNPHECVEVHRLPFDNISNPEGDTVANARRNLIRRLGLRNPHPPAGNAQVMCLHEGELSDKLLGYFAAARLSMDALRDCQSVLSVRKLLHCSPLRLDVSAVFTDLINWLDGQLAYFRTTMAEDAVFLSSKEADGPMGVVVRYRWTIKNILHSIKERAAREGLKAVAKAEKKKKRKKSERR